MARTLGSAVALAAGLSFVTACEKVSRDRARVAALEQAQGAIERYSAASRAANGVHGEVLAAFQKANKSASLPDYRAAIQRDVLPAMDRFIERLRAMPTGTTELERVHGSLVTAYSEARADLAAYADALEGARDLARFAPIRERLQQRVGAYRSDLAAYYRDHNRQLRLEAEGVDAPSAGTPSGT
jgi:hypothetical protein